MIDAGFLLGLGGLALMDALVTSTIYVTFAILVLARRPAVTSIAYALGQLGSFFVLTLLLYFGASYMAELLDSFTLWVRRVVLVAAAIYFAVLAVRRLKSRPRHGIHLPTWVNPWTAAPFGVMVMLVDLPFSFPMFLAVERLAETGVEPAGATLILAAYTLVSSIPTVLLIALGLVYRKRFRNFLWRLISRFDGGYTKPSWPAFFVHMSISMLCLVLLVFVLG
ncbi:GAP family protein [uncultured Corynebacterium sp.]|uniref:GAP family protein n=1 Tax=uncultured Corynebacterium sp. TaxID=159447 RepID=UPI0025D62862|nr:GAP family protein [uncultured Corynebacterium sp.]